MQGFVAFAVSLTLAGAALAASITNGSFEGSLSGWSASGVDLVCGGWQAAEGSCSVDMGGSPAQGSVSQDLATSAGTTYTVTFALAGNPTCTPGNEDWVGWVSESGSKTLRVTASPAVSTMMAYTFDVTGKSITNMGWTTQTFVFIADGSTTTLKFENTESNWCGPAIDNVTVSGGGGGTTPSVADQCKQGAWASLRDDRGNEFKNQGDCVSYVATKGKNKGAIAP